jgi:hypothetical protein
MSGPLINLATGEILIPDDDLSPEENRKRRDKMMGKDTSDSLEEEETFGGP